RRVEPHNFQVKADLDEILQFDGERRIVPTGFERQLIVSKDVGAKIGVAEVLNANYRNFREANVLCSLHAAVACNDYIVSIYEHWLRIAKALNGASKRPNLSPAVRARVPRMGLQFMR